MLESDWDTCVKMARDQVGEGAHVLDVCVDYVGRDGTIDMEEIASRFGTQASLPLVFDSTEPQVLEAEGGIRHHHALQVFKRLDLRHRLAGETFRVRLVQAQWLDRKFQGCVLVVVMS